MTTVYTEKELLDIVNKEGYRFITDPKTVFVDYGLTDDDLGISVITLRDCYGYMIQTEIK